MAPTSFKQAIQDRLHSAMKERNAPLTSTLRMMLAAIQHEERAGEQLRELTDDEILVVLAKEAKKRHESAEAYRQGNRPELAEKEESEAAIIAEYLPKPLTEEELAAVVAEEVAKLEDPSMKQMGQVIKAVNTRVQGRAEGAKVASLVKGALQ